MSENEIQDGGFESYKEKGGVLTARDYKRVKGKEEEGGLDSANFRSVGVAERMAANCGIDLTAEQAEMYGYLREIDESEVQREKDKETNEYKRSILGLSDEEVLDQVFLLTEDEENRAKLRSFYKNVFVD